MRQATTTSLVESELVPPVPSHHRSAEIEMIKHHYRHVTSHSSEICSRLLRDALENQHRRGIEIQPGWRHCARMVQGRLRDTKVTLYSREPGNDFKTAVLYAEILDHERGSVIVGEFQNAMSSRVFRWVFRIFVSILLLGAAIILVLTKLRHPQDIPGYGAWVAVVVILGIQAALMWWSSRNAQSICPECVSFVQRFIEESTTACQSNAEQDVTPR